MIAQLKSGIFSNRQAIVLSVVLGLTVGLAMSASASTGADAATVSSITESFTSIKNTALAALSAIAGVAILLFGAIYAWRYGKKVFDVLSK